MYKSRIANAIRKFGLRHQAPAVMAGVIEDAAEVAWAAAKFVLGAAIVAAVISLPYVIDWFLSCFDL